MINRVTREDLLCSIALEIEKINARAKEVANALSEEQLNWLSNPEAWSIAQCLEHLSISNGRFWPFFEKVIARKRRPGPDAMVYHPSWVGKWMIASLGPGVKIKLKTSKIFQPDPRPEPGALARFLAQQNALSAFVERAAQADINARLRSPATPLIRYSLGDAFQLLVVHSWRHLDQAQRVREHPDFPN